MWDTTEDDDFDDAYDDDEMETIMQKRREAQRRRKKEREARRRQEQWRDLKVADLQLEQSLGRYPAPAPATTEAGSKTSRHKLKQMKSSANKKMSSLKSQITDIYRYAKIV